MKQHVQKWGNNLGIRIPMSIAKKLNLHAGTPVTLEVQNSRIIIQPLKNSLDEMLKKITSKNKHHLLLEDESKGNHLARM